MKTDSVNLESVWNILFAASLCAILGAIGFSLYYPLSEKPVVYQTSARADSNRADDVATDAQTKIEAKIWNLDSQELGGSVLSRLTASAEKNHLQLSDFRIEKTLDVNGQTEAPFMVVMDGDFQDVMKMLLSLEGPDSKLGVQMLQMGQSDRGPGFVKATVGLTAFLRKVA